MYCHHVSDILAEIEYVRFATYCLRFHWKQIFCIFMTKQIAVMHDVRGLFLERKQMYNYWNSIQRT